MVSQRKVPFLSEEETVLRNATLLAIRISKFIRNNSDPKRNSRNIILKTTEIKIILHEMFYRAAEIIFM